MQRQRSLTEESKSLESWDEPNVVKLSRRQKRKLKREKKAARAAGEKCSSIMTQGHEQESSKGISESLPVETKFAVDGVCEQMDQEVEVGNVEYKLMLVDPTEGSCSSCSL